MSDTIYDLIQVGYGPVSKALATMLGGRGHSIAVFERWPEIYPLPRAVCIDHEIYRVLHANGFGNHLPRLTQPAPLYQWFNADWKELLHIDWTAESISGGPEVNFVHQPSLEATLDVAARGQKTVELNFGWEAIDVNEAADHVELTVRNTASGETRVVRSRYLVGVDGANSVVRQKSGIGREDRGFEADWLVVDLELKPGVTLDIPGCGQYCNPERPTTIVPGGMHNGRVCRRWEFMRLPHESLQDLESTEFVWSLLNRWVKPEQADLIRHAVYTFRSLIADDWRKGRVLIAGDAAHVMPPFMGQGMCAGMRDAWNLAWKLDMVLDGRADDRLLDTYTAERKPHVRDVIDLSVHLGRIICIPDAAAAAERDQAYLEGTAPPLPLFPSLIDGLLHRDTDGTPLSPAGQLSPHGTVISQGREGRWDEVVGLGFMVIADGVDPRSVLRPEQVRWLDAVGARVVHLTSGPTSDPEAVVDRDGKYRAWLVGHGLAAMIVRPDFYVFGGAATGDRLADLVDALAAQLPTRDVVSAPRAAMQA
jgi:2-polyprenyl-6-methoxyphenol hydroxylase-like FAD-dependent oxidoreductase